jgi:hypothetical protein
VIVRRSFPILFIAAVLLATPAIISLTHEASAQTRERKDNRTLLQRLFGVPPRIEAPRQQPKKLDRPKTSKKKAVKPKKRKKAAEPAIVTVKPEPKSPDALKVLVIGDYVAGGVAWGLEQTLADDPMLAVVDASDADAGLLGGKGYDGASRLPGILNEFQPHFVVLVFGANDRVPIRETNAPIKSDSWKAEYQKRIAGVVETLRVYGRPFFWVSAPPLRSKPAMQEMAFLNSLYRPYAMGGGHFIDIWDGFVSASGSYVTSGPDAEGQTRQLRTGDGKDFTRAGKLKLAFYVEREIRHVAGLGKGGVNLNANLRTGTSIEITESGRKIRVGPVLSLSEPAGANVEELVGLAEPAEPAPDSPQYKIIVRGESMPIVPGRVDDFSWNMAPVRSKRELLPRASVSELPTVLSTARN